MFVTFSIDSVGVGPSKVPVGRSGPPRCRCEGGSSSRPGGISSNRPSQQARLKSRPVGEHTSISLRSMRTGTLSCTLNDENVSQEGDLHIRAVSAEDRLIRVRLHFRLFRVAD
jgi:hypothetical protein